MLYKLKQINGVFDSLEPMPFHSVPLEKQLENLIARHLLDTLYESNELMPIHQSRRHQEEADIYALNRTGDLVIFELKRDSAGKGAVHQLLRYCETAAHWRYEVLQDKVSRYPDYTNNQNSLQEIHRSSFDLDRPLDKAEFNRRQHLIVVGSASDDGLMRNVEYWRSKGLLLDFVPYRIYEIAGEHYFEFFSLPYDWHTNPANSKGVLLDTNLSYDQNDIWYMCENDRVAAFGSQMEVVRRLRKRDVIFLYHSGWGVVAAGKITSSAVEADPGKEALFHTVEWLTKKPQRGEQLKAVSAAEVKQVLEHDFFWPRTLKTPYLTTDETKKLLNVLNERLGSN